jgi:hypothetical protein
MGIQQFNNNPFQVCIAFHLLIEHLETTAATQSGYAAERARALLKEIEPYPELRNGIDDEQQLNADLPVIKHLLADLFPTALTYNEIKAVTIPFHNLLFNRTERLKSIMHAAGDRFDITIRGFDEHQFYVMSCCLILNELYHTNLDFGKPMFYDIPNAEGIMKHYRMLYNGDFMDITPTEKSRQLTPDDISRLINNYDDLNLWMEMFPPGSYVLKGFAVLTLFDATIENAVSVLKGNLLTDLTGSDLEYDFESIFQSIYKTPHLHVGFTAFNPEENKFSSIASFRKIKSYMLNNCPDDLCTNILGPKSYQAIMGKGDFFAISDSKQFFLEHPDSELAYRFLQQNIQSFILAPVVKGNQLLGILELASPKANELNSVNAHKLEVVMPFLVNTIDRQISYRQNRIQAVIQNEYTTLHPSVQWKFRKEAEKYIERRDHNHTYELREVVFENVFPLYGQIDIQGSTDTRNRSMQLDINNQLRALTDILLPLQPLHKKAAGYAQKLIEFTLLTDETVKPVRADLEQHIQLFIDNKVHPLLQHFAGDEAHQASIQHYFKQLNKLSGSFHTYRRKYDDTISAINQKMATLLDERQVAAQQIFPHYYERFKTDGVEHNLYIGASIAPNHQFTPGHLHQLRFWQLQVLCEMAREHHHLKDTLPYPLEVTTLILAYSTTLSIRFRMDEKRFDVDGTYNARFEMVKKRIDKANIKGTRERITQPGKITIIYASDHEKLEYLEHLHNLQNQGWLYPDTEELEVEDLQSISGLKALRVQVRYKN